MGGKQQLTNIMDKFAANIAIQQQQAGEPQSPVELDIQTEQACMCAVYGIIECTDISVVNKPSQYINRDSGCAKIENYIYKKNDAKLLPISRVKRQDRSLGIYQFVYNCRFIFVLKLRWF